MALSIILQGQMPPQQAWYRKAMVFQHTWV
jgi:hypothetical protein